MALEWLTKAGIKEVTLCVNADNKKAISLYEKVGFKRVYQLDLYSKVL